MIVLAHGGAGAKKPLKRTLNGLQASLEAAYRVLKGGGSALDAVIEAVSIMEDSGLFNAGAGGNLQLDGVRRLDASLMDGKALEAGAVIGLEGFRNPIMAARTVMGLENKVFTNNGASRIARAEGLEPLEAPDAEALGRLEKARKKEGWVLAHYKRYFSTVGAVALDVNGGLAAGSSTGGVFAMLPGRVGDTPIIGSGIYADNQLGAVSCTGRGEDILRVCLAKEICMRLVDDGAAKAVKSGFRTLLRINGQAGVLALGKKGRWEIAHTTEYMPAGAASARGIAVKDSFRRIR